jgi:hypothetical protein
MPSSALRRRNAFRYPASPVEDREEEGTTVTRFEGKRERNGYASSLC